jgi:hypothetical protein
MFQKRLGYSMKKKKERKKKRRKRTNVPLKIKRDLAAQVFLKVFKFLREVYEISQRSYVFTIVIPLPLMTTSTLFSIYPFTTTYHTAYTHAYLDLTL